jgi:hypothetical protein
MKLYSPIGEANSMNIQILDLPNSLWLQILEKIDCDFYHLPEYLAIEANRLDAIPEAFLATDDDKIFFVPYLMRQCDRKLLPNSSTKPVFDVISPYGYPGFLYNQAASSDPDFLELVADELKSWFAKKDICSAFFRLHPILNQDILNIFSADTFDFTDNGETVAVDLRQSEAQIWSNTRSSCKHRINQCKRRGLAAKIVDSQQYLPEFMEIYQETMDRLAAKQSYYFETEYYRNLFRLNNKAHLSIVEFEGETICSGLFLEHKGIVQYHLSGTKNDFLRLTPMTLLLHFIRLWAKERGNSYFHLGGGLGGGKDGLYNFKAGFSKLRYKFFTLRLVSDRQNYDRLVDYRAKSLNTQPQQLLDSGFFPAYRFS